jgi:hypothetical protein
VTGESGKLVEQREMQLKQFEQFLQSAAFKEIRGRILAAGGSRRSPDAAATGLDLF